MLLDRRSDAGCRVGQLLLKAGNVDFEGNNRSLGSVELSLKGFGQGERLFGDGTVLIGLVSLELKVDSSGLEGGLNSIGFGFLRRPNGIECTG